MNYESVSLFLFQSWNLNLFHIYVFVCIFTSDLSILSHSSVFFLQMFKMGFQSLVKSSANLLVIFEVIPGVFLLIWCLFLNFFNHPSLIIAVIVVLWTLPPTQLGTISFPNYCYSSWCQLPFIKNPIWLCLLIHIKHCGHKKYFSNRITEPHFFPQFFQLLLTWILFFFFLRWILSTPTSTRWYNILQYGQVFP